MKICLTTSTFPAEPSDHTHAHFLVDAIRILQALGHEVCVLTQARVLHPTPPLAGLDVTWFPWRALGPRLAELSFSSPSGLFSAVSLLESGVRHVRALRQSRGIDVFLCAWVIPSGIYLLLDQILHRSRVPYALWALGSDLNKYKSNPVVRRLIRSIASRAGQLYADGHRLARDFSELAGKECEFLPTFRALLPRARTPSVEGRARFLYVGRHAHVKGTDVLIRALSELKGEDFRFDIVGDGEQTPELKRAIVAAELTDQVQFRGRLDNDELADAYAHCDCVVIPSRSESIPIVMSEALQYGLPLIVSDVGDMGDLTRLYQLGETIPAGDAPELARKIRGFMRAPVATNAALRSELLAELAFESAAPKLTARLEALIRR
ncbi:MAG TPA: glycosyltransferase [Polyangiaceae bacterium]|jgi:glycosyltransferase involved in cell wall biosynthesis